ncbi:MULTISPECIES: DUF2798 domain-containing protein [Acinetobacter]|uniref:DUF2798 domain-containing protein n=1 Tax=Acinetobacter wuhouensis TaxID=1879050 RepID=A0A3G2T7N6_9GAMM|nr:MULTISPECIES: DUF2798 domain-containing protein [Acinetobacter]AYO56012.1 DUF2798 domain-containing protein [Acinetobacter wuhouensis]RZG48372.1 DUF2798 domain-containing protein [Acinetobacter wuhouensis]RZG74561.1 DUF2798 domain-containing protein [Acinetobacter wuhouensis]RZG86581.1 DUF2798 domain-containing protein [Acinetobacter sp. WCHAc060033]
MRDKSAMMIGRIPKLPAKYAGVIMPLLLSGLMSGTISMLNLWKNIGWFDGFFSQWLGIWLFSWLVAFPTVMIFLPLVRRFTALVVDLSPPSK